MIVILWISKYAYIEHSDLHIPIYRIIHILYIPKSDMILEKKLWFSLKLVFL